MKNLPGVAEETLWLSAAICLTVNNLLYWIILKLDHFDRTRLGMRLSRVPRGDAWGCCPPWDCWQHLGDMRARPYSPRYQTVSARPRNPGSRMISPNCYRGHVAFPGSGLCVAEGGQRRPRRSGTQPHRWRTQSHGSERAQNHGSGIHPHPNSTGKMPGRRG